MISRFLFVSLILLTTQSIQAATIGCEDVNNNINFPAFIVRDKTLNIYFSEQLVLLEFKKYKDPKANIKSGFYKGLQNYVKKMYGFNSFYLESAEVYFEEKLCQKTKVYFMSLPLKNLTVIKENNLTQNNFDIGNIELIEHNNFDEFK